jgi:hypothetical protein
MKRAVLIALGLLCCGVQPKAQDSKKEPKIYFVAGTGWQTCSDWKDQNSSFKLGYLVGHFDGANQAKGINSDTPINESLAMTSEFKYGDYVKSLDAFCSDYRNLGIPIPNALEVVVAGLTGLPAMTDQNLESLRCLAMAGADRSKIDKCHGRHN